MKLAAISSSDSRNSSSLRRKSTSDSKSGYPTNQAQHVKMACHTAFLRCLISVGGAPQVPGINRTIRGLIVAFVLAVVLLVGGIATYLGHVRSMATALVASACEIRTTEDAERAIAGWKARAGNDFWTESDDQFGDHNYDASIVNLPIARLRVVQPTGVTVGLTMRDRKLRSVTVIQSTGWYPVASVWIQDFDDKLPKRFRVLGHRKPYVAAVEFPSSLPERERTKAFQVNTKCLVLPSGCKNAGELLPGIWQLKSD